MSRNRDEIRTFVSVVYAASTQLDGVKGAEDATWRNMRNGVTQAFTDLENSLKTGEEAVVAH